MDLFKGTFAVGFCVFLLVAAAGCSNGSDDDSSDDVSSDDAADDTAADDSAADDAGDDTAADDSTDDDSIPPPQGCDTLKQGYNEMVVNGLPRYFYVDLPTGVADSWPWPIVFNWHGYGDTAENMRTLIDSLVDFEGFPFIGITPEDTNMLFDWDIVDAANPDNRELLFFDAVLAEADKCWGVDKNHIHVMGFSFGGGVADMMGTLRGDIIASIATCSGIYGNDPADSFPNGIANWPPLTTENKYVEFRLHGGVLDNMILPFGQYGINDGIFLNGNGHDYVQCIHPYSHNMGFMYMGPQSFIEFFRDHPFGTTVSPYKDGFPADYKSTCEYDPKQ